MSKQNYGLPPKDPALLELIRLRAERDALRALLPGVYYMDPPDGGDVDVVEQFRRMAEDAKRCRELEAEHVTLRRKITALHELAQRVYSVAGIQRCIDAALKDKP